MKNFLVIIPVYNEEKTIGEVIDSVKNNFPQADILVINDGSDDNSSLIAGKKGVFVIDLPYNLGIGGAMQTGFKFAEIKDYDLVIQVDADGQHEPEFISKLIEPLQNGNADMAIGSRFASDSDYKSIVTRRLGIKLLSSILSIIVRQAVTDATSGFRAANKKTVKIFAERYPEDYPEVEAILLLRKQGLKFVEVPVMMSQRKGGCSSITPFRSVYYMLKVLLSVFITLFRRKGYYGGGSI